MVLTLLYSLVFGFFPTPCPDYLCMTAWFSSKGFAYFWILPCVLCLSLSLSLWSAQNHYSKIWPSQTEQRIVLSILLSSLKEKDFTTTSSCWLLCRGGSRDFTADRMLSKLPWQASSTFLHSLSDVMKDQLVPLDLPADFDFLVALTIMIDN